MLQAATAFGGGVWVCQKLGELPLPTFQRALNERDTFKLRVRLHSASTPGLAEPGVLTQERPRLEVVVGRARKETEFGDYQPAQPSRRSFGGTEWSEDAASSSSSSPWRFNETLTFSTSIADVLSTGVQVWLWAQSDVRLGPLQVSMSRPRSIGMCSVDFLRRVIPACVAQDVPDVGDVTPLDSFQWETPALSFPLTYVGGGDSDCALGEIVGSVKVSFSIDVDPAEIQSVSDASSKSLLQQMADPVIKWVANANVSMAAGCGMVKERCRQSDVGALTDSVSCNMVKERARQLDVLALADARCEVVKEGRPQSRMENTAREEEPASVATSPSAKAEDAKKELPMDSPPLQSFSSVRTTARSLSGSSIQSQGSDADKVGVAAGAAVAACAGSSEGGKPAAVAPQTPPPPAASGKMPSSQSSALVAPPVYFYKMPAATPAGVPGSGSFSMGDGARVVAVPQPKSGMGITYVARPAQFARSESHSLPSTVQVARTAQFARSESHSVPCAPPAPPAQDE